MNYEDSWEDLYFRLKNAEHELEELADATNDPSEASRLMSKMHGVSLARDYMRGYFDPSSVTAAAPNGAVEPETMPMDWADRMVYLMSLLLTTPSLTLLRNEQKDWDHLIAEWRTAKIDDGPHNYEPAAGVADTSPNTDLSVWKFVVYPYTPTSMIEDAEILYVGAQGNDVCIWALCDPMKPVVDRNINAYGTGHVIPDNPGRYIGSTQMQDGLVFHLFDGDDV